MQTRSALIELFELLEEYAPAWYSEEHHLMALHALAQSSDERAAMGEPLQNGYFGARPEGQGGELNRPDRGRHAAARRPHIVSSAARIH